MRYGRSRNLRKNNWSVTYSLFVPRYRVYCYYFMPRPRSFLTQGTAPPTLRCCCWAAMGNNNNLSRTLSEIAYRAGEWIIMKVEIFRSINLKFAFSQEKFRTQKKSFHSWNDTASWLLNCGRSNVYLSKVDIGNTLVLKEIWCELLLLPSCSLFWAQIMGFFFKSEWYWSSRVWRLSRYQFQQWRILRQIKVTLLQWEWR